MNDPKGAGTPQAPDGPEPEENRSMVTEAPLASSRLVRHPDFPLTLTRALLETLELRRILYVILSGTTAGDGLGFNRAFLWLEDEGRRALHGQLAIGPANQQDASRIWEAMEAEEFDLQRVMQLYDAFEADTRASRLANAVEQMSYPLPISPCGPDASDGAPMFVDLLGPVLDQGRAIIVNQQPVRVGDTGITLKHCALVPLLLGQRAIGVLAVDNAFNDRPVAEPELHDLQTLANLAAVAVERARLYERLRRMAEQDGLTGLLNRRRFDELLPQLFDDSRRHREPLSILLIDADHFKAINDRYGHLAGDDVLRELAALLKGRIRQGDLAARYGGDELAVLLPQAAGPEALGVAEFLCAAARETRFGGDDRIRASISVGVATVGEHHADAAALLAEADEALYAAKEAGRDTARIHPKSR